MPRSGTRNFDVADDFQANFRDGHVGLVFTRPGTFKARQTWVEFIHIHSPARGGVATADRLCFTLPSTGFHFLPDDVRFASDLGRH